MEEAKARAVTGGCDTKPGLQPSEPTLYSLSHLGPILIIMLYVASPPKIEATEEGYFCYDPNIVAEKNQFNISY